MIQSRKKSQGNLFEESKLDILKNQVKELDMKISRALKKNDFNQAKELTDIQAELLNQLLQIGDTE